MIWKQADQCKAEERIRQEGERIKVKGGREQERSRDADKMISRGYLLMGWTLILIGSSH